MSILRPTSAIGFSFASRAISMLLRIVVMPDSFLLIAHRRILSRPIRRDECVSCGASKEHSDAIRV
jgi:predicted RNA-binding protein YlxR (DUF448 family)